jgi:hypothetical protein
MILQPEQILALLNCEQRTTSVDCIASITDALDAAYFHFAPRCALQMQRAERSFLGLHVTPR